MKMKIGNSFFGYIERNNRIVKEFEQTEIRFLFPDNMIKYFIQEKYDRTFPDVERDGLKGISNFNFFDVLDIFFFFMINNHFHKSEMLQECRFDKGFFIPDPTDYIGLQTELFGINFNNDAGLRIFDLVKYDASCEVQH